MRNGQNKHHRMRGRNRGGKSHNPLTRVYESNGPDVKIRGTANHVAEKYIQLARDATASGDPVAAENYYQHAEHYFRLIAAAQEQFRQTQPFQQRPDDTRGDESFDDADDSMVQPHSGGGEPHYAPREQPQPYPQRDYQGQQHRPHQGQPDRQSRGEQQPRFENRPQPGPGMEGDVSSLPSFITGGQPQQSGGANGHDAQGERFPLHRRRRRHRGAPGDMPAAVDDGGEDVQSAPEQGRTE